MACGIVNTQKAVNSRKKDEPTGSGVPFRPPPQHEFVPDLLDVNPASLRLGDIHDKGPKGLLVHSIARE